MDPNITLLAITTKLTWLVARRNLRELLDLCMTAEEPAARIRPDLIRAAFKVPGENEALQSWSETGVWTATDLDGELAQDVLNLVEWLEAGGFHPDDNQRGLFEAALGRLGGHPNPKVRHLRALITPYSERR